MTVQLPREALGLAIGVLSYSFLCLALGLLTIWLTWVHGERTSYIFLLATFASIGTLTSMAQQIHTIVCWRRIKLEQYNYSVANAGSPELALAGASYGLDLVLFYIQFTCYNVEAFLIFFWSAALLRTVFQLEGRRRHPGYTNFFVKLSAILVPVVLVSILQVPIIRGHTIAFLSIANGCMAIGITGSACMLFIILGRYIYTRHEFLSWNVRYRKSSIKSGDPAFDSTATTLQPRHSLYDKWLLVRFTVGFIMLGAFQIILIMFEVRSTNQNDAESLGISADLSPSRAKTDFIFFMPGASPPLVTFVVFGTTTPFREYMWTKAVPRWLKSRDKGNPRCSGVGRSLNSSHSSRDLQVYALGGVWAEGSNPSERMAPSSISKSNDEVPILGVVAKGSGSALGRGRETHVAI